MQIITQTIKTAPVAVEVPTHRIVVIDCSYSMVSELPKIRTHLKNKIPTMVKENDLLSIVWFSSKGEYGTLVEAVPVSTLKDLSAVNTAIDRFVKPVGATAFVQPLQEVVALTERVGMPSSMFFLTDGWDNGYTKPQILKAAAALADVVGSTTFVEYGWYADHDLLSQMAEEAAGSLIQSNDFTKYSEQLEQNLSSRSSGKKQKVSVPAGVEFLVAPTDSGFVVSKVDEKGVALLPAEATKYSYLSGDGQLEDGLDVQQATLVAAALVQRGKADLALEIAGKIGDADVYTAIENAFSKQDYVNAVELMVEYGTSKKQLYTMAPKNTNLAPNPNAYNVLQLLMDIATDDGNLLHISHPEFKYSSIGRKREVAEVNGFVPKFIHADGDIKAPISTLKFDEDRPNVSILVRNDGHVYLPKNDHFSDEKFETFNWRNYTVIKDGIINLRYLPLILTAKTHKKLKDEGVITEDYKIGKTYLIDTKSMPVINRAMVSDISATKLGELASKVYELRCIQKAINASIKEDGIDVRVGFKDKYGEDATAFLKEYGITEGGFSPKTVSTGDTFDAYTSKSLAVKLKGLSSIPSLNDLDKALKAGKKLTPSQSALKRGVDAASTSTDLVKFKFEIRDQIQELVSQIVKTKFSVILGKKWFSEFSSIDENTITIKNSVGDDILVTFALEEKEVS